MFKVIDEIINETIYFKNKIDAEMEAERRFMRHKNGYSIRRNYIPPIKNAKMIIEGDIYRICLK